MKNKLKINKYIDIYLNKYVFVTYEQGSQIVYYRCKIVDENDDKILILTINDEKVLIDKKYITRIGEILGERLREIIKNEDIKLDNC